MKRTLSFLTLAMCATMGAWAQVKIGNIYYNLDEETKTAEVTKPQSAYDYSVKYSGDIVIPASVTYEGKDYTVTSLGKSAFAAFYDITSIVLPTSLRNIGEYAFSSCIGLSALEIPEGVETIGKSALVIPNSVDSIGQSAFSHCNSLESIKFGSGLRSVGRALFEECAKISTVEISKDNPYFDSREGCNAIIETSTNKLVAGCNATVVPSSVKSIALGAFMYCTFTSFELPEGLEEIEKTAFYTCRNLKEITIPASVKSLSYSFYHCSNLESLKVDRNNKVYDSRENCNAVIETATNQLIMGCKTSFIPEGVTSIGDAAFSGYWDLSSIELPSSLTSIGIEAFTSCGLTSVTIPDGVTTIGVAVFSGCRALKTISLPQSLTSIGLSEFSSWDALSSIYVYANQPPTATGQGHLATDVYNRCTLYVPKGSEEAYADAEGWKDFKDIVAIPDEMIDNGIAINETNFPDINFRNWVLEVLECGADGVLKDVEITDVTRIVVTEKGIQNLKGIEYFTALKELYCNGNQLTSLDVSKNRVLKELYCYDNQLTSLDVSQNTALENLKCYNNRLTSLNVSECTALTKIECYQNQLKGAEVDALVESLSITNGKMYAIHIENEQNAMTTVQVAAASAKGWLVYNFDGNSWNEYFVEIAIINETNFPDENFRNWVLSQEYGDDGVLTNVEIAKVTRIDVSNKGIQNLKGIEYFTGLTDLNCASNRLTTLDVSKNTGLKTLICFGNPLTSLDLSGCTVLKDLWCYSNQIKGKEMDALVESLPTVDWGTMYAILSENEQNVMTTTQVAAAKAKGWRVYYYDRYDWFVYAGSEPTPQDDYRQFVEDGKVWMVRVFSDSSSYPDGRPNSQWTEYYYFAEDTVINNQTAKRMMCVTNANYENWENGMFTPRNLPQDYVGAWYEQDKKVYFVGNRQKQFELLYDFTLETGNTIQTPYGEELLVKKLSGGIQGFKGSYYDFGYVMSYCHWLEGVGSESYPYINYPWAFSGQVGVLLACRVGEEIIYYNSDEGDPFGMGAKKRRFDFTHTVKIQPKTPQRRGEETALYGEYNDQSLDIRLDPLDEAYSVCITNQKTGETLYEKNINAGSIVALNIDISKYPEGQYKISIDNSNETFNGVFDTTATGINEIVNGKWSNSKSIYNLQGQRINGLQKGLNIVDGKKILVR